MAELTKEQKRIIRLIEKEAIAAGIDPDFAIAIANLESTFQHIPAQDKKSTAFGPFQVNKATAQANGVDYDEMKSKPDLAVKTGVMNLARHAKNPLFEGNPMRIVAAHRFGENSEYAKTGDESKIDKVLAGYLADTMEHFPEQTFPQTVYTKPTENAAGQEMDMGTMPLGSTEPIPADGEAMDMGSQPLATYSPYEADKSDRYLGAAEGAGAGAFVGAVKVPAISLYKKAYDYLHRAPQVQDVNAILEAANKVNDSKAAAQAGGQGSQGIQSGQRTQNFDEMNKNAKYTARFAKGVQLTPAEIASSTGMGKGETEAWGIIKKAREANQKIDDLTGVGSYTLDPERNILVDTSAGGGARGTQKVPVAPAIPQAQKAQSLADYEAWANAQNAARAPESTAGKVMRTVAGSSPVKYGLAGAGIGYNTEDAFQKFKNDDYLGGLGSLGAAAASGATLIPKYAARANPAAVGLTTASQAYGDIKAGKPQEAAETTLSGLAALAPRIFGPIGAALFSSGLNKNEDEELARYRSMKPPHLRP